MTHTQTIDLVTKVQIALEKLQRLDPEIHSFLPEPDRQSRLTQEAEKLMREYEHQPKPWFYGQLIGVKDIFRVDGLPTQAGSRLPTELFAGEESVVVTKIKHAGGLIIGKTVSTEFAAGQPNETVNPIDHNYSPGGSSSGSAAAVAAGLCDLGIGSQTIGSTLRPASYCGIVGFKPSFGRINTARAIDYAPSLDTVGLFTQTVEQLLPAAEALLSNWTPVKAEDSLPVLGIPEGLYLDQPEAAIKAVFTQTVEQLRKQGFEIRPIPMFSDIAQINEEIWQLATYEMARVHTSHGWYPKYKDLYRQKTIDLIEGGLKITEATYQATLQRQKSLKQHIEAAMTENKIEAWISPATLSYAPEMKLSFTGDPTMNIPWTFTGLPSISIPIKKSGIMPLGLQVVAEFMDDEKLLSMGQAIQSVIS